jgi:hypothetical protein
MNCSRSVGVSGSADVAVSGSVPSEFKRASSAPRSTWSQEESEDVETSDMNPEREFAQQKRQENEISCLSIFKLVIG